MEQLSFAERVASLLREEKYREKRRRSRAKRAHRRRSHDNKVPFLSMAAASAAAIEMEGEYPGQEFNAYACDHCNWYHVGHVPAWLRKENDVKRRP